MVATLYRPDVALRYALLSTPLFHQTRKTKLKNYKADLAFRVRSELLVAMVLPSSLADFTLTAS